MSDFVFVFVIGVWNRAPIAFQKEVCLSRPVLGWPVSQCGSLAKGRQLAHVKRCGFCKEGWHAPWCFLTKIFFFFFYNIKTNSRLLIALVYVNSTLNFVP